MVQHLLTGRHQYLLKSRMSSVQIESSLALSLSGRFSLPVFEITTTTLTKGRLGVERVRLSSKDLDSIHELDMNVQAAQNTFVLPPAPILPLTT